MNPSSEHQHEVRKVVLESGKTIEVLYLAKPVGARAPKAPGRPAATALHVCPSCASTLVHPRDWEEAGPHHWWIDLRCPECEWAGAGEWDHDVVDAFDDVLDRGTQTLVRDLRQLAHANMEDEIERFAAALRAGLILPEDF
jgi:hypothetical protein